MATKALFAKNPLSTLIHNGQVAKPGGKLIIGIALMFISSGCLQPNHKPASDWDEDGHDSPDYGGDDCDDTLASVHPGAAETCNGIDDDCDGSIDENPSGGSVYYVDSDGDGYGNMDIFATACSMPGGFVNNPFDCNDMDEEINLDAQEVCDLVDNDCDGLVDDQDDSTDLTTGDPWYADNDGDGYGDPEDVEYSCTGMDGRRPTGTDCDDNDTGIHPGQTDTCNEVDDDCDGTVDEGNPTYPVFRDADGDGVGSPFSYIESCAPPSGYSVHATDCDDSDPQLTQPWDFQDSDGDGVPNCMDPTIYEFNASAGIGSAEDFLVDNGDGTYTPLWELELCRFVDPDTGTTADTAFWGSNGPAEWGVDSDGAITEHSDDSCSALVFDIGYDVEYLNVTLTYEMTPGSSSSSTDGIWIGFPTADDDYVVSTYRYPVQATPPLDLWWFDTSETEVYWLNGASDATLSGLDAGVFTAYSNGSIFGAELDQITVDNSTSVSSAALDILHDHVAIGTWDLDSGGKFTAIEITNPLGWTWVDDDSELPAHWSRSL